MISRIACLAANASLDIGAPPDWRRPLPSVYCVAPVAPLHFRKSVRELATMTRIYVGNLPFTADENQVRTLFAQHGTVESVNVIMDRDTGRPRGFAFVEMSSADASRAIQSLNG